MAIVTFWRALQALVAGRHIVEAVRIVEENAVRSVRHREDLAVDLGRRQGSQDSPHVARQSVLHRKPAYRTKDDTEPITVATEQRCVGGATYVVVGKHPPKI